MLFDSQFEEKKILYLCCNKKFTDIPWH